MSQNIESGVFRALKAYKVEGGMADQKAAAWAKANLAAGVARFTAKLNEKKRRTVDDPTAEEEAYDGLKKWATSA